MTDILMSQVCKFQRAIMDYPKSKEEIAKVLGDVTTKTVENIFKKMNAEGGDFQYRKGKYRVVTVLPTYIPTSALLDVLKREADKGCDYCEDALRLIEYIPEKLIKTIEVSPKSMKSIAVYIEEGRNGRRG